MKEKKIGQNRQDRTDMIKHNKRTSRTSRMSRTNDRTAIRMAVIGQKGPLFLVGDE